MTDYSKVEDPTPPEEYARQRKEREEMQDERHKRARERLMENTAMHLQADVASEKRMQRIEDKLDEILELLRSKS